jgi:hypothetical protein
MILKTNGHETMSQPDWGAFLRAMKTTVQQITSWPIQIVLTAHVKRDTNELTQTVEKLPLISGQFAGLVPVLFDEVYFAEVTTGADKKAKFTLQTHSTPTIRQAKSRLGVPSGIETDYANIAKYLNPQTATTK